MTEIGRVLVLVGLVLVVLGLLLWAGGRLGLGKLPGDILIERDNFTFYFPLATSLLLSLLLTLLLWIVGMLFGRD